MSQPFMVPQTAPVGPVIEGLLVVWSASEAEEWAGQVLFFPF